MGVSVTKGIILNLTQGKMVCFAWKELKKIVHMDTRSEPHALAYLCDYCPRSFIKNKVNKMNR